MKLMRTHYRTYWVTNRNMIASNTLLAEFLKTKLAARPREYTLVKDCVTLTPNMLNETKNKMTRAMKSRI